MNTNFDDFFAQNSVQSTEASAPAGDFLKSLSKGITGGLDSVNQNVTAAEKAQEAFAMGGRRKRS